MISELIEYHREVRTHVITRDFVKSLSQKKSLARSMFLAKKIRRKINLHVFFVALLEKTATCMQIRYVIQKWKS